MALRLLGREGLVPRGRRRWYSADAEIAADAVGAGAGPIQVVHGDGAAGVQNMIGRFVAGALAAAGRGMGVMEQSLFQPSHLRVPLLSESPSGNQ